MIFHYKHGQVCEGKHKPNDVTTKQRVYTRE